MTAYRTGQQERVYEHIVEHPGATRHDIAAALGRPTRKIDNAIKRLIAQRRIERSAVFAHGASRMYVVGTVPEDERKQPKPVAQDEPDVCLLAQHWVGVRAQEPRA